MRFRTFLAAGTLALIAAAVPAAAQAAPAQHRYTISTCRGGWAFSVTQICLHVTAYGTRIETISGNIGIHDRGTFPGFWRITMPGRTITSGQQAYNGPFSGWHWYYMGSYPVNRTVRFGSQVCVSIYQGTFRHNVLLRQDCGAVV